MRNKFLVFVAFTLSITSFAYAKSILNVQQWQSSMGTKIYFVNAPQIPMVDIMVAFHAGSDRDGPHYGLASLTANMLGEATNNLNADAIANKMDSLGMEFDSHTDKDMTVVHMRSLTSQKYLEPSLALFTHLIANTSFPAEVFNRVKNNTLQAIAQAEQSPGKTANRNFSSELFKGSPYAHSSLGNMNTVKQLTPAESTAFYKQYYVAKNAVIVIVGDITGFQAKAMGTEISNALPEGKVAPKLPLINNNKASTLHVNFPADQTAIRIGEVGVAYKQATNHALIVGNYILGSGMTSRLFTTVRGKYGLTYGIGSYFVPLANRGAFIIVLQTRTKQTKQAINITKKVVSNYLKMGPTSQELKAAKAYLIGSFPLKVESNSNIANYVLTSAFYHLPFDYLNSYTKDIQAVTSAQAKAAMNKYVHPKDFVIVTVGKPDERHVQRGKTHVSKKS